MNVGFEGKSRRQRLSPKYRLEHEAQGGVQAEILKRFRKQRAQRTEQDGHERNGVEQRNRRSHRIAHAIGPRQRKTQVGVVPVQLPADIVGGVVPKHPRGVRGVDRFPPEEQERVGQTERNRQRRQAGAARHQLPQAIRCARDRHHRVRTILVSRTRASNFQLPTSNFALPASRFPLPTSHFPLPTSNFELRASDFETSRFALQTYFGLPLHTSHFTLPHFRLPTSDFKLSSRKAQYCPTRRRSSARQPQQPAPSH